MAKFQDEAEKLRAAGASTVFYVYTEAGAGFAAHVLSEHTATSSITCRLVGPQFDTEFVHEDRSDPVVADAFADDGIGAEIDLRAGIGIAFLQVF